jgi:hypothetical protein
MAAMRILHAGGILPQYLVSLSAEFPQDIGRQQTISTLYQEFSNAEDQWQ